MIRTLVLPNFPIKKKKKSQTKSEKKIQNTKNRKEIA